MKSTVILAKWIFALSMLHFSAVAQVATSSSVESGYIFVDESSNVVISAPEGRVLINGMDVVALVGSLVNLTTTLTTRVQQLEGIIGQLNVSKKKHCS
jgi:hypothetical protein